MTQRPKKYDVACGEFKRDIERYFWNMSPNRYTGLLLLVLFGGVSLGVFIRSTSTVLTIILFFCIFILLPNKDMFENSKKKGK